MIKSQWIQSQRVIYPDEPIASFVSILNTKNLVANPTAQGYIPKPISIVDVGSQLSPNDRRILQNEYTYRSLIININKGDMPSSQADLQNLITTPNISQEAINILNNTLTETMQTILDPNWQAQIMASPAELAGFGTVLVDEVEEALG